jgi:hypothetical protein
MISSAAHEVPGHDSEVTAAVAPLHERIRELKAFLVQDSRSQNE